MPGGAGGDTLLTSTHCMRHNIFRHLRDHRVIFWLLILFSFNALHNTTSFFLCGTIINLSSCSLFGNDDIKSPVFSTKRRWCPLIKRAPHPISHLALLGEVLCVGSLAEDVVRGAASEAVDHAIIAVAALCDNIDISTSAMGIRSQRRKGDDDDDDVRS